MDTIDTDILKILCLEEKEDDEVFRWYLSREKRKNHDQDHLQR